MYILTKKIEKIIIRLFHYINIHILHPLPFLMQNFDARPKPINSKFCPKPPGAHPFWSNLYASSNSSENSNNINSYNIYGSSTNSNRNVPNMQGTTPMLPLGYGMFSSKTPGQF